jgi:hypothetical protein
MSVGPTMAARVVGGALSPIGQGKRRVFDLATPADAKPPAVLDGLGATGQIAGKCLPRR